MFDLISRYSNIPRPESSSYLAIFPLFFLRGYLKDEVTVIYQVQLNSEATQQEIVAVPLAMIKSEMRSCRTKLKEEDVETLD